MAISHLLNFRLGFFPEHCKLPGLRAQDDFDG
jgi:hypothetical protein